MPLKLTSYGASDVGRKRPHNEDAYLKDDVLKLYAVADGVGGHAKGEVASQESVEQIQSWVKAGQPKIDAFLQSPNDRELGMDVRRLVDTAVQQACWMIFGLGELDPQRRGMSTTMSALLICGETGFIGQVGDSRVYLLREGELHQLTEDHTLINYKLKHGLITKEEAERAPGKNVITRAVGHRDHVEVDTTVVKIQAGDRFLLCSDGLHGLVEEREIQPLLKLNPLSDAAKQLIALANDRGGKDNITTVIISFS
jgi:protein phosphatase